MPDEATIALTLNWAGPFTLAEVIERFNDGGSAPRYDGNDYGLYQIYGVHILAGSDSLLYLGKATGQTFSARFRDHRIWLEKEEGTAIYLGRIYDPDRHRPDNDWTDWERDVDLAERILIYKYSPNYNAVSVADPPSLKRYSRVELKHTGRRHRLHTIDVAPDEWALLIRLGARPDSGNDHPRLSSATRIKCPRRETHHGFRFRRSQSLPIQSLT